MVCQMSLKDWFPRDKNEKAVPQAAVGKKYELVPDQRFLLDGMTLYRVRAMRDFGNVKCGDLGGFVMSESNLSQDGNCWIYHDGQVFGNARIYGNATVCDSARVFDEAQIGGNVRIFASARVYGWWKADGHEKISGYVMAMRPRI